MDVVVIGAGIIGASVAYRLVRAGARVTVVEEVRPAGGTSSNSFAWTNANDKPPREYQALNKAGMDEHLRLHQEIGGDWYHPTGNLEIASEPKRREALREKVKRLRNDGYAAELIGSNDARELQPDIDFGAVDEADIAYYPDEGWVAVPLLIHDLLHAVERSGGRVIYPARATSLLVDGDRVVGVETAMTRYDADLIVDCSGPSAGELLAPLGVSIGRKVSPGLLIVTEPMPTCLSRVVHFDRVYFRPDGAGRVRIGASDVDSALRGDRAYTAESPECLEILNRACAHFPNLRGARIQGIHLGWRPMPSDGLSAVGPIPGLTGYCLVFTHSGVTLGPLLARLVADEATTGEVQRLLEPFRPGRIVNATSRGRIY